MLAAPTANVAACDVAEVAEQRPQPVEELAVAGLDPEDGRQLADHDRQAETEQEAGHHRLGHEVGDGAEPEEPGRGEDHGGHDGQAGRERREVAVSPPASGATAAADTADVAVVALTTSERDVPMSA